MPEEHRNEAEQKRFDLKRKFLSRAIENGKGPWAIGMLNRLHRNVAATKAEPDHQIIERIEREGQAERAEIRRIILECLEQTEFGRAEDPEIQEMIDRELDHQKTAISVLRSLGVPEDMLPEISPAIARLNAYERKNGQNPTSWSPADSKQQEQIEQFLTLARSKPPTNTLN
ncbi:MAG: hypothetical protein ACK4NR_11420 [Micavibrio sp.]